ncbi:MAG: hypothetical protein L6Q46_07120 [Flavobacterium sp.]|uniref:hypothetical protein n=1 Tax=Flavobacterium sp. TaxID=239 RepID=UPI0025C475D6|nr:hypothetical protein [Flavobacterium sp.]MCK6608061.1 hypothetical protein [Flavobacterium sp.]
MSSKKRILIFFSVFGIIIISSFLFGEKSKKRDFKSSINFVVHNKKINSALKLSLFNDKGKEFDLGYVFYSFDKIYEGDSLVKYQNSHILYVYRKSNDNSSYYSKVDSLNFEHR